MMPKGSAAPLTRRVFCSLYFHVSVETLGEAFDLSWSVHMRCLHDGKEGLKHRRDCNFRRELDLETLVCTRGRAFPIGRLAERRHDNYVAAEL